MPKKFVRFKQYREFDKKYIIENFEGHFIVTYTVLNSIAVEVMQLGYNISTTYQIFFRKRNLSAEKKIKPLYPPLFVTARFIPEIPTIEKQRQFSCNDS